MDGSEIDVGRRVLRIEFQDLFVEGEGSLLFARFLGLHRGQKAILHAMRVRGARTAQRIRLGDSRRPVHPVKALKVEEQLAANGVDHGATVTEGEARPGTHQACLEQRIGHAGHGLHGHDRMPDGGRGHIFLAQGAQGP